MRKIAFRAWDKEYGGWLDNMIVYQNGAVSDNGVYVPQKHLALMQFTGLLDKNGKEIYEGDVQAIEVQDPETGAYEEQEWEVKFENGYFNCNTEAEIIGNVWEHPELLNEKKV